jgi:hypothetical protein
MEAGEVDHKSRLVEAQLMHLQVQAANKTAQPRLHSWTAHAQRAQSNIDLSDADLELRSTIVSNSGRKFVL